MTDDIARLRIEYGSTPLHSADVGPDPGALFRTWFDAAVADEQVTEANAMALATTTQAPEPTPSVRMVLLKDFDPTRMGFTCFTNLESRKASEIDTSGRAGLCWWWAGLQWNRQVRVTGDARRVAKSTSQRYFESRGPEARIGAATSRQSRAIGTRRELDARVSGVEVAPTEVPASWGGIEVVADEIEFWQGRAGRLHDRFSFLRVGVGGEIVAQHVVAAAGGEAALRAAAGDPVTDAHGVSWLRVRLEP